MLNAQPPQTTTDALRPDIGALARRIRRLGTELHSAVRAVTQQVATTSRKPHELARSLRIHRTLASRLLNAVRTDDPLAAISRMPRSEGLRMFLTAAKSSASRDAIEQAETALRNFEHLVDGELGGWDGFDAVITEWLPDAREKFELANKQAAFKGMANLLGVRADVQLVTSIYYPDADGQSCDIAVIEGMAGLRRLRPSARIPFAMTAPIPGAPRPLAYVLEGLTHAEPGPDYPLLDEFCSKPIPRFHAVRAGKITNYFLAGNEVGENSAVDVYAASVIRHARPIYADAAAPGWRPSAAAGPNVPAKVLLLNFLVHEDIWPESDVELRVYDTHVNGLADANDPARDIDRLELQESVQVLGKGAARFRATEVGRHVEMVQYVCDQLNWDSNRLRGYRLRVQYPLYNAQYCLVFDPLPPRPQ
ncbi:MAG: hypothetical protein KBH81_12005 [Phycisphaerae bacterium]|nr:hypothetical protein [Phycisphaerae bacterium]HRT40900.1 hypothetical protein [Phycisphaerae bacterium]